MRGRTSSTTKPRVTVREAALNLLARRRYTEAEVATRLRRKGYAEEEITETVAWLRELRYLDDETLAGEAAVLLAAKHWGPARVTAKLKARGLGRALVERVGGEAFATVDQRASARTALRHRFGRTGFADGTPAEKKRASNFLFRMGFDWDTIRTVIKSVDADE
jgi:regulatory protein